MKNIISILILSLSLSIPALSQEDRGNFVPSEEHAEVWTSEAEAQEVGPDTPGTVQTGVYAPLPDLKPLTALLGVGVPVAAFDLMHLKQDQAVRGMRNYYAPGHRLVYDDILAVTPLAAAWGMRLGGLEGRSETVLEAVTAQGLSLGTAMALTYGTKYLVKRVRPDGSSATSFPSGHSAFAFASAAILDAEYGDEYPWVSALGYTAAVVTGAGRILNNRHWASDVVTGAGIGLGSAYLGYYLSDLIFGKKGGREEEFFVPMDDAPWMFGVEKGFHTYFSGVGDYKANRLGNSTGVTLRVPLYGNWGLRLQGALLESRNTEASEAPESLQGYLLLAKADYMHPFFGGRLWLDGNAGLGYGSELRIQVSEEPHETSAPFVTRSLPISLGAGATMALVPRFGIRLGADYLFAFNARPYSRDTKNGMNGLMLSLTLNYLIPR